MKKSLLALAVFGAFAGAASAQTSVTAYGVADVGFIREYGSLGPGITKLDSGIQSGSRLGFKGTEDLGSGLKALFQLETGIAMDTGGFNQGNRAFGRQAWVGLAGNFGMVSLGRQYQSQFIALDEVDPFGTGLAGNSTNLFRYPFGSRNNNMIKYSTPETGGFTAEAEYGFGEVAGDVSSKRTLGGSIGYANGPAVIKLSYEKDQLGANGATNLNQTTSPATPFPNTITGKDFTAAAPVPPITGAAKYTQLTGSYDFSVVKLAMAYRKDKDDQFLDANNFLVGVSVPFGASSFMASYIRHKDRSDFGQDANQIGVGYTYALSKRTNFYSSYARINNSNAAGYTVGNAISDGSNEKAFNVGVRHKF